MVSRETGRGRKKNEGHVTREPNAKTFCVLENQREKPTRTKNKCSHLIHRLHFLHSLPKIETGKHA